MTARTESKIHQRLTEYGWQSKDVGATNPRRREWCRWNGPVRQEIVCIFDGQGRLDTWSYWENRRMEIDGDPGRRARLDEMIATKGHLYGSV